ncbi:type I-F CRISPR-associated protein Csy3 [Rheinheimera faecalis]|uniref:type I-F CRISPR-associated protein Csy3 n=1 Tax=Rheinheimera faecalis TaxID=2901141 RepID=UPI001E5026DB|nr:type I-F CRISPR-associated protein Csy3 [Rheinheimera faecalis]
MKLPQRFSYRRSLSPSIGVFTYADKQSVEKPLSFKSVKIVGQKEGVTEGFDNSMMPKASATAKKLGEGNLHTVEYCHVPYDAKRMFCRFSLTVNANSISPEVCNDPSVLEAMSGFVKAYSDVNGYTYLAERYLKQIISGTWLWRNQYSLSTAIRIRTNTGHNVTAENVHAHGMRKDWQHQLVGWTKLVEDFSNALTDHSKFLLCEIEAELIPVTCQEIYPSQAFNERGNSEAASRVFQRTQVDGVDSPILGAYKIGAAIAQIDDWFDDAIEPLRVGQYGVDKKSGTALRSPENGLDFFSTITQVEQLTDEIKAKNQPNNRAHFLAANLIKGGLFQKGAAN